MAGNPLTDPNWAADVTGTIVSTIDKVRRYTTTPIVRLARALVFGLLGGVLAVTALILLMIGISRGLISFLEWPLDHDTSVWVAHTTLGAIFVLIGTVCMAKRQRKDNA